MVRLDLLLILEEKLNAKGVKTNFIYVHHEPNSLFLGILIPFRRNDSTVDAVVRVNADFGVAFDGDFDRCFLFDQNGEFVSGEHVSGLLAEVFTKKRVPPLFMTPV